jgi:hypothetical protein
MHLPFLSSLSLLLTTTSIAQVSATPITTTTLSLRADTSYGTTWRDPYISKPQNFQIRSASSSSSGSGGCDFQLAYERDPYDNRHDVFYVAEYADGSS